jgi:uncharacterized protein Yka (UPF0111/DUF47 family)
MSKLKPRAKGFFPQFKALAQSVADGAAELTQITDNSVDAGTQVDRLVQLADAGDANYDAVLDALHSSFITPFDRDQIQLLASALTSALRHMEGADAVDKLSKLKGLRTYRTEIRKLSTDAEVARRDLLVNLTSGAFQPLEALKLRFVEDELGQVMTAFRAAAEVVESVLIAEG